MDLEVKGYTIAEFHCMQTVSIAICLCTTHTHTHAFIALDMALNVDGVVYAFESILLKWYSCVDVCSGFVSGPVS